jgi:hypothetical protein
VTRHRTRIERCQCREVALNLGSHRSETRAGRWCCLRLIDNVLTPHVDSGQMVRQLVTYGSDGTGDFFVPNLGEVTE